MTVLKRVSAKEMKKRTGFGKALGYSFPEEDEILIREDLPKDLEHEVIAHEEEHISKGEEGPFWGAVIGGALGLLGAKKSSDAQKDAARTASEGSERDIEFQRESRDLARADQAPYRKAGYTALNALMSLTGLGGGGGAAVAAPNNTIGAFNSPVGPDGALYGVRRTHFGNRFGSQYHPRYSGGPIGDKATYNINELGPESVYSGGAITRTPNPATIDGKTGYVLPHSRAYGGNINEFDYGGAYVPPNKQPGGLQWNPGGNILEGNMQSGGTTALDSGTGYPRENPGGVEGGYQFQTDPGYQFRFEEGQRALDRGAAARGGLLSGGYGRKAIRYGQGFASNEFSNVYNRISNIAGLGQVSAGQSGNYALQAGYGMGNAASQGANATAYGQIGSGNAWANAGNQIAQIPWGDVNWGNIFNRSGSSGGAVGQGGRGVN